MEGKLEVSIDKLPVKRLDHIEENGVERYPAYASSSRILMNPRSLVEGMLQFEELNFKLLFEYLL